MRAQVRIGLILLAIIAIVALVGLILMFAKRGATQYGIGEIYGPGQGIAQTYPTPPLYPGGPYQELPWGGITTISQDQTPALVFFPGQWATIAEMGICWAALWPHMADPQAAFSCYSVPTTTVAQEAAGGFPPSTSWRGRPPAEPINYGGTMFCYANTPYDREALVERLKQPMLERGWQVVDVNGKEALACLALYKPRPQG